jgi:hypothetical protein
MVFAYRRYLWKHRRQTYYWRVRRRSMRDGLIGGHRGWLVVGVLFHGPRLLRKLFPNDPEVVAVERLTPGSSLSIRAVDRQSESST